MSIAAPKVILGSIAPEEPKKSVEQRTYKVQDDTVKIEKKLGKYI